MKVYLLWHWWSNYEHERELIGVFSTWTKAGEYADRISVLNYTIEEVEVDRPDSV